MNLYAESSAVLAWLLGEESGPEVARTLGASDTVMASDLTVVECARVLIRGVALGELTEADAADRRAQLDEAAARWNVLRISPHIVDRARRPFPGEPIRALDALHLASALEARAAVPGVEILSLDLRIRAAGRTLGFRLQPSDHSPQRPEDVPDDPAVKTMDVEDFTTHFLRSVEDVEQGAEILITRAGQPFARMVPAGSVQKRQPDRTKQPQRDRTNERERNRTDLRQS